MNETEVARKEWLVGQINKLKDKELFGELTPQDKIWLDSYYEEYLQLCHQEAQEKAEKAKETTRRVKRAKWRGQNEERACAKMTKGVVVGRSKAVQVNEKWYKTDCQKPPDVISPPYSLEVKNRPFPKTVGDAMTQAVTNAPEGLSPLVWWRDNKTGVRYIIQTVKDFIEDHI